MHSFFLRLFIALPFTCALHAYAVGLAFTPISRIPDPPPALDGSLKRFESVPGWLRLDKKEQVVFNPSDWRGPDDLSADVVAGWDSKNFYIAAKVRDQGMRQPYKAQHLWKGSHIMLFLEIPRRKPGQRAKENIYHIGISPGDVSTPEPQAEIYRWQPKPGEVPGAKCAVQALPDGYWIEAAIPWEQLGLSDPPQEGMPVGLDIALSSSDQPGEVLQSKIMSLITSPWHLRDPDRLLEAVLADSEGVIDPAKLPQAAVPITGLLKIESGEAKDIALETPATLGHDIKELVIRARMQKKLLAGGMAVMRLFLNGTELTPERSRNRGETFELGVRDVVNYAKNHWFVLYSPDFAMPSANSRYSVRGINPYEFQFDVKGLWRPEGPNTLRIEQGRKNLPPLQVEVLASTYLSSKTAPLPPNPAPTGPLPTFAPAPRLEKGQLTSRLLPGGAVSVSLAGMEWIVRSSFSTTEPGWAQLLPETPDGWTKIKKLSDATFQAQTAAYELTRTLDVHQDHVTVRDTFKNLSGQDEPILIRHEIPLAATQRTAIYLNGRPYTAEEMASEEGENPTSLALTEKGGIGLVSEDDILRVQADNFYDREVLGIRNNRFVLAPGKEITLEFSIYPLEKPDRFLFVNRIRENWGVNRPIPGSLAILHYTGGDLSKLTKEQLAEYFKNKDATIGIVSYPYQNGQAPHGNLVNEIPAKATRDYIDTLRTADPNLKIIPYFHSFISNAQGDRNAFAKAAIQTPDGKQITYGNNSLYPMFVPVEGTPFAKLQEQLVDKRFDDLGVDGIYWDEFEYSQAKYQFAPDVWDGVTGSIDLQTHKLLKKISSITLLTLPWRDKMARSILSRGIFIVNGQALTRTATQLAFPRFIETASTSNLVKGQLGYPIALGDHLSERNERDCYRNMVKGLDYGALYYWYRAGIIPTHPTLTRYMFPATPMTLGEGFLIAQERILTNRSGLFGWGDQSDFTSHVFDRTGVETSEITIPKVEKDGQTFAEVRIPEGYSVALVRKPREDNNTPLPAKP